MPVTPRQRAFLEQGLGRPLTDAELHIDVAGIDRLLEAAKDRLEQAVDMEKRRAVRRMLRGHRPRLDVTGPMVAVLRDLVREGRRHAGREIQSLGVEPGRAFAVDPVEPRLEPSVARLRDGLARLEVRVGREAVAADIGGVAGDAVRRRLLRVPGARDAASRVVSGAFTAGLAATFEDADAQGLFAGWQYTAVLDTGTCPECRERDGRTYRTLEEAYADLPNFGPNPRCFGDGRCRCRLVPTGAAGPAGPGQNPPVTGDGGAGGAGGGGTPPAPPGEPPEPPELHPKRVPGSERAYLPAGKARYLLGTRGKREYFGEILGFAEREEHLERELLEKVPQVEGHFSIVNPRGRDQYVAVLELDGPTRTGFALTVWQVMEDGRAAFVTSFPFDPEKDALPLGR